MRLGRLVLEPSFVLNDEVGSGVEAVVVERVVVEQVFGGAAVVDALTWGALRASEDQDRELGCAILPVDPVLLFRSISIRALCREFS